MGYNSQNWELLSHWNGGKWEHKLHHHHGVAAHDSTSPAFGQEQMGALLGALGSDAAFLTVASGELHSWLAAEGQGWRDLDRARLGELFT